MNNKFEFGSGLTLRPYSKSDFNSCIRIFETNVPRYFDANELSGFKDFLEKYASDSFWVIEKNRTAMGCGGIRIHPDGSSGLCYGMIDAAFHGHGLGRALACYRLLYLLDTSQLKDVKLETSQNTYPFFEKFGFETTKIQKDFYGDGLDCYSMHLTIPIDMNNLQAMRDRLLAALGRSQNPSDSLLPPP